MAKRVHELSKARRYFLFGAICISFLISGFIVSLQPTFYPKEAESKGATPSQYGFVYGAFSFAAFFSAPLIGRYGDAIGAKLVYNCGRVLQAVACITFGLLQFVDDALPFLVISYIIRFLEGLANAASSTVGGILIHMFPDSIASVTGQTRMFMSIGYMMGPMIGSFLYSVGGFGLPFYTIGSIAMVVAIHQIIALPKIDKKEKVQNRKSRRKQKTDQYRADYRMNQKDKNKSFFDDDDDLDLMFDSEEDELVKKKAELRLIDIFKRPSLMSPFVDAFTCFIGYGMVEAMLEPHLKNEAGATQIQVAWTFFILGMSYLIFMPVVGFISDKTSISKAAFSLMGNFVIASAMVLLGPLPFLPMEPSVFLIMVGIGIGGLGFATIIVTSFAAAHAAAIAAGYDNNIRTNLVVSGVWTASFNLGAFAGPTSAGLGVQYLGFRNTTLVYFCIYSTIAVLRAIQLICSSTCLDSAKESTREIKYHNVPAD